MPIAFVTDSTAYIPEQLVKEYSLSVAPQVLIWGDESFRDGIDIQPDEFYARLKTAKVMLSTSQASIVTMQEIFQGLVDKGFDVLGVFISAKLSGTMQSAIQGREALGSAASKVTIIDGSTTAMAMGFQVLTVARLAQQGANLAECKALAEKATAYTGVIFAVDTLEFLHRGGRIGGATRFLGTMLNFKPILELRDGRVEPIERVRTRGKSLSRIVELTVEQIGKRTPVRLSTLHANAPEDAKWVLEEASAKLNPIETVFSEVSPVVGVHAGPGVVGIVYMAGM